jgi:hypothetical protein
LVSQHLGWPQLVTPLIVGQPINVPYLMWYNTVPSFVPMDPNMYSMYCSRIKGPNPLISRRNKGYVVGVTQLEQVPLFEQLVQN